MLAGRLGDGEGAEGAGDDFVEPSHDEEADRSCQYQEGSARVTPWHGIFFKGIKEDCISDQWDARADIEERSVQEWPERWLHSDAPTVKVLEMHSDGATSHGKVSGEQQSKEIKEGKEVDEGVCRVYGAEGVQASSSLRGNKHEPSSVELEDDDDEDGDEDDRAVHDRKSVREEPVLEDVQVKDLGDGEAEVKHGLQSVIPVSITIVVDDAIEKENRDRGDTKRGDHVQRKVSPSPQRPGRTSIGLMGSEHVSSQSQSRQSTRGRKRKNHKGAGRHRFEVPTNYIPFECAFVDCPLGSIYLPDSPKDYTGYTKMCQRKHQEWHSGRGGERYSCSFCGDRFAGGVGFYLDHMQARCTQNFSNFESRFRTRYRDNYAFPPNNSVEKERHLRTMQMIRLHAPGLSSPIYPFDELSLPTAPPAQACSILLEHETRIKRQKR